LSAILRRLPHSDGEGCTLETRGASTGGPSLSD
jgi:hypothetical protein